MNPAYRYQRPRYTMISTLRAILRTEGWQAFAASEAKRAIVFWLLTGVIYQWWNARLLSLPTIVLFVPGIFVASFAQIIPAMVNAVKTVRLTEMRAERVRPALLEALWWIVWWLFDWVFIPTLAVLSIRALNTIL
jgi:hypothetical protein